MSNKLSPFEKAWKKRFEQFSNFQSDAAIAGWSESGLQSRVRYFLHFWKQPVEGLWLDIGCGAGTYSHILKKSRLEVVAVDYSFSALLKAKIRYDSDINWSAANIYQLPFPIDSFDGIVCFGVLQTLSKEQNAIREIIRVLKPSAELWVDGLNLWCMMHWYKIVMAKLKKQPLHLNYLSPFSLILKKYKYKIYWLPIFPEKLKWIQLLFYNATGLELWQKCWFINRFFSHGFLIKLEFNDVQSK